MAQHHDELLQHGVRTFGISVDGPGRNAAMIDKLGVPFPLLSDPDRSGAISPLGLADPDDPREIAIPAMVLFAPDRSEVWRYTSRDFADRLDEAAALDHAAALELPPAQQDPPATGTPDPGPRAAPLGMLSTYFRGAKFAGGAMARRHGSGEDVEADVADFQATMDRYIAAVKARRAAVGD